MKNGVIKRQFTSYIVDYKIEDEHIRLISSKGTSKLVAYNLENINKVNQVIVRNKIMIAKKIDDYDRQFKERLVVLLMDILILGIAGICVPFAFFTGNYIFFLTAIIVFSLSVITTSVIIFDYYILIKEIQYLKKITGYKRDTEFSWNLIKSH